MKVFLENFIEMMAVERAASLNTQIAYKNDLSDFYNFSTRVLGLNANPLGINTDNYWYNADRFLREAGFFEDASPKKALKESTYYKRRQLVV